MKNMRDPKRRPTHPGEVLREDILPALNLTQGEIAPPWCEPPERVRVIAWEAGARDE